MSDIIGPFSYGRSQNGRSLCSCARNGAFTVPFVFVKNHCRYVGTDLTIGSIWHSCNLQLKELGDVVERCCIQRTDPVLAKVPSTACPYRTKRMRHVLKGSFLLAESHSNRESILLLTDVLQKLSTCGFRTRMTIELKLHSPIHLHNTLLGYTKH